MNDELKYSEQAMVVIKNLSSFDKVEFEKWFNEGIVIGSNTILQYLMQKEKAKQALITKPKFM